MSDEITTHAEEAVEETVNPEMLGQIVTDLVEALKSDEITPYQVSSVLNGALQAMSVDKVVKPQMMYNYDRNGLISGQKGKKRYTSLEVVTFVLKYVGKRI